MIEAVSSATTEAATASGGLGQLDSDAFLKLLVAQMKYQNPLAPTDASAMLERRTSRLQEKNDECQQLQTQLDQTLTLVFDLMAEDASRQTLSDLVGDAANGQSGESEAELEKLRNELDLADYRRKVSNLYAKVRED